MAGRNRDNAKAKKGRLSAAAFTVRLLPVTIFVAALVLSVRVNDIWRDFTGISTLSVAEAQQPPPPGGRKRGQKAPGDAGSQAVAPAAVTAPAPSAPASDAATPAAAPQSAPASAAAPPSPAAVPSSGAALSNEGEPPTFTQNEIDVLQKLAERRDQLDGREREINLRENMIKAAESRIDKKIAEMKALQANIESMLKQVDEQDKGKMKTLVRVYESMKPKEAAKIFNELDMPVLLSVMSLMKEPKIASIMEAMDPGKAKALTDSMAQRRSSRAEGQGG